MNLRHIPRSAFLLLVASLSTLTALSCNKREKTGKESTLQIVSRNYGYPTPFAHYPRGPGYVLTSFIFDSLVWKDKTGFIPLLCTSWEKDGTTWRFSLRNGVMWHDGKKLTAEDVKFTFDYMRKYPFHWSNLDVIESIKITKADKIEFKLKRAYPAFLNNIAGAVPIIPRHIWQGIKDPVNFISTKAYTGTGPYTLSSYKQAKGVYIFKASEKYFLGKPTVDNLIFRKTAKPELALLNGEVDAAIIRNGKAMKLFKGKKAFKELPLPHSLVIRLMLNADKFPTSETRFRKALAYIIDREKIVKLIAHGHAEVGKMGYFPSDSYWFNDKVYQYPFSLEKGKKILTDMGFTDNNGDGFVQTPSGTEFSVEFLGISGEWGPAYTRVNGLIKKYLEKAGIRCKVKIVDLTTRDKLIDSNNFEIAANLGGGLLGDPEFLQRKNRRWVPYKKGSKLDIMIGKEALETDEEKRREILLEIQEEFSKEVLTIPLFYPNWYLVYTKKKFDRWFHTWQGIAFGIPLPYNKLVFLP